ncbi:MAG TPA: hypothetical protein VGO88_06095 [Mycetocola sp.]|nr:hypothetical protein [Mycetocola sp.]
MTHRAAPANPESITRNHGKARDATTTQQTHDLPAPAARGGIPHAGSRHGLVTAFDHDAYRVDDPDKASVLLAETVGMIPLADATGHDRETSEAFYGLGADVLRLEANGPPG